MQYSRRHFIGITAAGIGSALSGQLSYARALSGSKYDPYEIVELGNTGIRTTRLCMGTGVRANMRQSNLTRLGFDEGVKLVRQVYDHGVRMFDCADTYGSHAIISEALKIYPRKDYVIFSKIWFRRGGIPETERFGAEYIVERFLKELQTDYIDGIQLHCVTSEHWNTELSDYMETLDKLKQKGVIRSHGLSAHSLVAMETAVREPWVDCFHARYNAYGNNMDDTVEKVTPIVKQLHQGGKAIIAMKIMGEGAFSNNPEQKDTSLKFVLESGIVDVMNIGFDKMSDLMDTEVRIRNLK